MRKSVSVAFFSLMSTLLIFGTVIMGSSELVLFSNYFAQERYDVLDEVVNVAQRTASHLVQEAALPEGEELEALNTKLELIGESAEVYLFFTDCDGNVVLASDPENLAGDVVEASVLEKSARAKENYHVFGTLDGVLTEKSYISVREMRRESGECTGYLFLCSSGDRLVEFRKEFFSNFFLSACLMLLVASVLTKVMMHKLTDPIQKVTDAAQRFGGGDLSVRVEGVDGEGEVADLARTFNKMADNIQSNDNSRGQFMGNIAHELRTPMTTIKGFIDGMLDGTIPPDMQNHYLQLVSEETGRLARLIQNMLDLSKLESGEYQVNARMFNIWETLTGVALSAEQRINDGMIDIDGLTMDEKVLVYADPDLIHQVAYNLLDNAIKFTPGRRHHPLRGGEAGPGGGSLHLELRPGHQPRGAALRLPALLQRRPVPGSPRPGRRSRPEHLQGAGQPLRWPDTGGEQAGRVVQVRLHPARPAPQPRRHEASARRERPPRCGGRPGQHEAGRLTSQRSDCPSKERSGCFLHCGRGEIRRTLRLFREKHGGGFDFFAVFM